MIPLSSQTWRGTQREHFPMTTANTWKQEEPKTLSSGWRIQKGTGECIKMLQWSIWNMVGKVTFPNVKNHKSRLDMANLLSSKGVYSDAMQTAPTPAMWALTCRTRQPKSLSPGWRPAEAEETNSSSCCCSCKTMQLFFTDSVQLHVSQPVLHFLLVTQLNVSSQEALVAFSGWRRYF